MVSNPPIKASVSTMGILFVRSWSRYLDTRVDRSLLDRFYMLCPLGKTVIALLQSNKLIESPTPASSLGMIVRNNEHSGGGSA